MRYLRGGLSEEGDRTERVSEDSVRMEYILNETKCSAKGLRCILFVSGREFYCIHLFFKRLSKLLHVGISLDVRITGNTSGFIHSVKCTLAVARHFDIERKSAPENTLMEEKIHCTGHVKAKFIK